MLFAHTPRLAEATPQTQTGCAIQGGPTLQGYTFRSTTANHGDTLPLSLYWQGTSGPDVKYFVRLVDGAGTPRWSADLVPGQAGGKSLQGGGTARDDLSIPVDATLPFGTYRLVFGAYSVSGGQITPLGLNCSASAQKQPDGTLLISNIEVQPRWSK